MGRHPNGQWRPIGHTTITPPDHRSRPSAPAGELSPPKPVARSTDAFEILPSNSLKVQHTTPTPEQTTPSGPTSEVNSPPEEPRKLIATIPEAILASLRSTCAAKAEVSLLGRIHGKHPGLKALTAWARDTLHPSLTLLSLKTNNLFEVTFSHSEGRIHALTQADLVCDTAAIFFSSWRPHFDSKAPHAAESLDHPVWVQIVDLCQVLREESFLRLIGEQLGQVISIDSSDAYRAKLFGPRIRLLVRDIHHLPQTVVIPRLDGDGTVEYKLEFSGLPKQCGRCRAHDHLVRNCPRRTSPVRKKEDLRNRGLETKKEALQETEPGGTSLSSNDNQHTELGRSQELPSPQKEHRLSTQEHSGIHSTRQSASPVSELGNTTVVSPTQEHSGIPSARQSELKPVSANLGTTAVGDSPQLSPLVEVSGGASPNKAKISQEEHNISMLKPDDVNFPKLQTPPTARRGSPPKHTSDSPSEQTQFIWGSTQFVTPVSKPQTTEGGRGKEKQPESAPLTRQGYRSGRLAEDFWSMIGMPNTPPSHPKMLRVIPFLTKNRHTEQTEYLVDRKGQSFGAIAHVHVAELLAGIPWTQARARQHVVNEVSQALQKTLIFNNNLSNPFQRWTQGRWFAQWGSGAEGEHICTLFVSIDTPEHKVKPRKGFQLGWRKEPEEISTLLASPGTEDIQIIDSDQLLWQKMAGKLPSMKSADHPPESHNRFASLLGDEAPNQ